MLVVGLLFLRSVRLLLGMNGVFRGGMVGSEVGLGLEL